MDRELLQLFAANTRLIKFQIDILNQMNKNGHLNQVQIAALDESKQIYRNLFQQLQRLRDENVNVDLEDFD